MYRIEKIKFKDWLEYTVKANDLLNDGWIIEETLEKTDFGNKVGKEHIVRLIK